MIPDFSYEVSQPPFKGPVSFKDGNFFKQLKWSPDGSILAGNTEHHEIRILSTRQNVDASVQSDAIHDFSWYPWMRSNDNEGTCCFVTAVKDQPLHLHDANSGKIRCSYTLFDQADQVDTCYSACWSADGQFIYGGSRRSISIFNASRPGRSLKEMPLSPNRKSNEGQSGPVSCLDCRKDSTNLIVAGTFNGSIGIYDPRMEATVERIMIIPSAHEQGISQVKFSEDGWFVYSAARKDGYIKKWDLRNGQDIIKYGPRVNNTNQRLYFDITTTASTTESKYLYCGDQLGNLHVFDIDSGSLINTLNDLPSKSAMSSVSINPKDNSLVCSFGERSFDENTPPQTGLLYLKRKNLN